MRWTDIPKTDPKSIDWQRYFDTMPAYIKQLMGDQKRLPPTSDLRVAQDVLRAILLCALITWMWAGMIVGMLGG